jgi:GTPase SAR1 family protein
MELESLHLSSESLTAKWNTRPPGLNGKATPSPRNISNNPVPMSTGRANSLACRPTIESETDDETRQTGIFDSGSAKWSTISQIESSPTRNIGTENQTQSRSIRESLRDIKNLNILILGEIGSGKSTFINAFLNYFLFDTVDQAAKSEELAWLVPCTFLTEGYSKEIRVKVSDDDDTARISKHASAAAVYCIPVGSSTIRLIDTIGIGDISDPSRDEMAMNDLLSVIQHYEELHGIVILVNTTRTGLVTVFKYCMKKLLAHLSRNAVPNIVFCFTATRSSNYTPTDILVPLSEILEDNCEAGPSLSRDTIYCFDSETFRYLAALKNGIDIGHDDIRRSWDNSRKEAFRLVDHIMKQLPHRITSTIILNRCRLQVVTLTKSLQEFSAAIKHNVASSEDMKARALSL